MFTKPTIGYPTQVPGNNVNNAVIFTHSDGDYKLLDFDRKTTNILVVTGNPNTTLSLQPQQSLDEENWFPLGAPITVGSMTQVQTTCPFFRLVLQSFSSATDTLTVTVG